MKTFLNFPARTMSRISVRVVKSLKEDEGGPLAREQNIILVFVTARVSTPRPVSRYAFISNRVCVKVSVWVSVSV